MQKTPGGNIEYNIRGGKNCTLLRPITLTDVNVISNDGIESINGESCTLNSDTLLYVNTERIINKIIPNNGSFTLRCKTNYRTTDNKGFVYRCNDGELSLDNDNSSNNSDCGLMCGGNIPNDILDNNSNIDYNNISGTFYNSNGDIITNDNINESNLSSLITIDDSIIHANCSTGYAEVDENNSPNDEGLIYTCSNGVWTRRGGCKKGCTDISPVYDVNNNKVSDRLYGITYAGEGSRIETILVACKGENTSSIVNLNTNGTGLNTVMVNEYIKFSLNNSNLIDYISEPGRKLVCTQNNSVNNNEPYWQYQYKSCDLNELKNYSGMDIQLSYESTLKDINTIMTTGAKQIRFFAYNRGDINDTLWSKPKATLKKVEGDSISGTASVTCKADGTWDVSSSGEIDYAYTGNVQTFTPKYYGAEGKKLTLEVWGGRGSGSTPGSGGYSNGMTKGVVNYNVLYVVVGGGGGGINGGYNGGGNSGACHEKISEGGGGASHIATSNGVLKDLVNNKEAVLIVAGGGGGQASNGNVIGYGGAGGGANQNGGDGDGVHGGNGGRVDGNNCASGNYYPSGGHCISNKGGTYYTGAYGGFGYGGGDSTDCNSELSNKIAYLGGGGGGGYYGGSAGSSTTAYLNISNGAGGAGYCNTTIFTCSGSSGTNSGDGKASISW